MKHSSVAKSIQLPWTFTRQDTDTLLFILAGDWRLANFFFSTEEIRKALETDARIRQLGFDAKALGN